MVPPRKTKRFGPLLYTTLALALTILGGFWLNQFWNARTQRLANLQHFQNLENTDTNVRLNALVELHKNGVDCSSKLIQLIDHEDPGLRRFGSKAFEVNRRSLNLLNSYCSCYLIA